ncbi:unnamed protein product [Prorocentrum cordatum]|uniref:TauD/TfdA-like domain-containing protein n=1 Tax=Prorocentrum cordatum TaxID=2364126 RepID=A0ABN9PC01_9DINO|nr:unnamed protein product [Polarella glacialis]
MCHAVRHVDVDYIDFDELGTVRSSLVLAARGHGSPAGIARAFRSLAGNPRMHISLLLEIGLQRNLGEPVCVQTPNHTCHSLFVTKNMTTHMVCARVEVARAPEVLAARHTKRRGYRNAQEQRLHVDSSIPAARGAGVCDVLRPGPCSAYARRGAGASASSPAPRTSTPCCGGTGPSSSPPCGGASGTTPPRWSTTQTGGSRRRARRSGPWSSTTAAAGPACSTRRTWRRPSGPPTRAPRGRRRWQPRWRRWARSAATPRSCSTGSWELARPTFLGPIDNYRWLHARTAFEDDPALPRLFFRLWLQVDDFDAVP